MAEGAGLLILCRGNLTEGSNPSDSEEKKEGTRRVPSFFSLASGLTTHCATGAQVDTPAPTMRIGAWATTWVSILVSS